MTEITAQIISTHHTRAEALAVLREFAEEASERLFSEGGSKDDHSRFDSKLWKLVDKKNVNAVVAASEKEIKEIPILTVYLPTELPPAQLHAIVEDFIQSFSENQFLLDFKIDPNLIAGCALVWQGKYGDFSIKSRLEEKKGEIRELILN